MTTTLPRRDEVPLEHTWDITSIFPDMGAWEGAARQVDEALPALAAYQGRLGESAATLLAWLQESEQVGVALGKLLTYASMAFDVDTTNQEQAALRDRSVGLMIRYISTCAFAEPEILATPPERLAGFHAEAPGLAPYRHYLDNLQRQRAHVRSAEVEQLLAQADEPFISFSQAYQMLTDGDLRFAPAVDSAGAPHTVAQGTIDDLLQSADHALRQSAWYSYADAYLGFKNSIGMIYAGSVKADVFRARSRGFASAIEASLFTNNIPRAVYDNVIDACNRHLPIWHRYWDLRRRGLGLSTMEPCDIWASLAPNPTVGYAEAVEMICAGMAPLGDEYVRASRAGLTSERWVDIYPNQGKTNGAYSSGTYGTRPFILMSYDDTLLSMSTLAHELGHSMHSWYTNRSQPPVYSHYSLFVAEVASNFNQALVRGHLLREDRGREFSIALIQEAMANFHRYLFLMPILSQFELTVHSWAEAGEAVTGQRMNELLAELFSRGYGPAVAVDPARVGITWAQFGHLYANFYVYQYASGIAAANALAADVLDGTPGAADRYLKFLATGSSRYPLDALAIAGIDMSAPDPLDRAFGVLSGFVDRLEALL